MIATFLWISLIPSPLRTWQQPSLVASMYARTGTIHQGRSSAPLRPCTGTLSSEEIKMCISVCFALLEIAMAMSTTRGLLGVAPMWHST